MAAQQQVPTSARIANRAPNIVKAILAQETGNQAKTITKTASTHLHQHLDISASFAFHISHFRVLTTGPSLTIPYNFGKLSSRLQKKSFDTANQCNRDSNVVNKSIVLAPDGK
jgi:hypothetical protein